MSTARLHVVSGRLSAVGGRRLTADGQFRVAFGRSVRVAGDMRARRARWAGRARRPRRLVSGWLLVTGRWQGRRMRTVTGPSACKSPGARR